MPRSEYYVGQVKVERISKDPTPTGGEKRGISEVAMITVKADSLSAISSKLQKHIDLIEDDA